MVIEGTAGRETQALLRRDQAGDVVQGRDIQGDIGKAGKLSVVIVQRPHVGNEIAVAGDQSVLGIQYLGSLEVQGSAAQHAPLVPVVEGAGVKGGLPLAAQGAALVVQGLGGGDLQVTIGDDAFAGVAEVLRRHTDV